jgi:hypothetical protein
MLWDLKTMSRIQCSISFHLDDCTNHATEIDNRLDYLKTV